MVRSLPAGGSNLPPGKEEHCRSDVQTLPGIVASRTQRRNGLNAIAHFGRHQLSRFAAAVFLVLSFGLVGQVAARAPIGLKPDTARAGTSCQLNSPSGNIHHVIYIQFDNVHFRRDRRNVPSDLEQMPHLLNFMRKNGVLLTNEHTPLIAHTANDILTSLTGNYPDNVGQPVANGFGYFDSSGNVHFTSSFKYWTDPVSNIDTAYNLIDAAGKNTPAPWVPFTRAGCDVGAFGTANIELENISSDIQTVFTNNGNPGPAGEASSNPTKAVADFEGISVHCAQTSALCSSGNGGEPDQLPQEPGGYSGFNALYGAKYVNPAICATVAGDCSTYNGSPAVNDLNGSPINDGHGNAGFPGFDPLATQSLGYVAAMQEAGIPVTYAYIADAHDNHSPPYGTFGPGEAGYVAQLKAYDQAFAKFFSSLNAHGINRGNTLFIFTADEGDHFVGGPSSPSNCNGVTTPCTYGKIGEIDGNLTGLLNAEDNGIATAHPFSVHSDSAPVVYMNGNPAPNDETSTRPLERAMARLKVHNPYTGGTDRLTRYLADVAEMKLLHMVTAHPARTPTFTPFDNPNYYLYTDGATCDPTDAGANPCTTLEGPSGFAWNHGTVARDINTLWLGFVGPGVRHLGTVRRLWTDETDIRPTLMALTGLKDDYTHDGRVLWNIMDREALPKGLRDKRRGLDALAFLYKQMESPVGFLGYESLIAATRAIASGTASDDSRYMKTDAKISRLTTDRNKVGAKVQSLLEGIEFNNQRAGEKQVKSLIRQEIAVLKEAAALNGGEGEGGGDQGNRHHHHHHHHQGGD